MTLKEFYNFTVECPEVQDTIEKLCFLAKEHPSYVEDLIRHHSEFSLTQYLTYLYDPRRMDEYMVFETNTWPDPEALKDLDAVFAAAECDSILASALITTAMKYYCTLESDPEEEDY